ncbi:hypothetical protein KIL84_013326 [Mauremys mutica]|uniref:Uncharacterized protein n=1 Tax=Mauremys mutica TaxID=74926 RepID=A0A9D4AU80_9SAUR|nr:hypothetical protein KIL84_013326 [Mauremys mutica]
MVHSLPYTGCFWNLKPPVTWISSLLLELFHSSSLIVNEYILVQEPLLHLLCLLKKFLKQSPDQKNDHPASYFKTPTDPCWVGGMLYTPITHSCLDINARVSSQDQDKLGKHPSVHGIPSHPTKSLLVPLSRPSTGIIPLCITQPITSQPSPSFIPYSSPTPLPQCTIYITKIKTIVFLSWEG